MFESVIREAQRLVEASQPFVLATVVRTKGSTPQKPGAKLLVRADGSAVGTLGGGCVEADVWARAKTALEDGSGLAIEAFTLTEELAARDGLVCGGTMEIVIDPVRDRSQAEAWVGHIHDALNGGKSVVLATLLKAPPDFSAYIGAKLLVREDGYRSGTLGDKELDREAADYGWGLMAMGGERYLATSSGAEVFLEAFTCPATILVAGGGHIAKALYTLAKPLGFRVAIVDDRPEFASAERFPLADKVICREFVEGIREAGVTPNTFIVIATRGHKHDDEALLEAAKTSARYVGLVGSRRKAILIYRDLLRQGIPLERVKEVRAPVGLDLGGRTPEEIALAILAEMVAFRFGASGQPLKMDERLAEKARQQAERATQRGGGKGLLPMV